VKFKDDSGQEMVLELKSQQLTVLAAENAPWQQSQRQQSQRQAKSTTLRSKSSTQSTRSKPESKGSRSTGAWHLFAAIQSPMKRVHQKCKAAAASRMATTATNDNKKVK
jgi:hypothetical protein